MKYFLTLTFSLFFVLSAWAQPANDECVDLIDLGVAPVCTDDIYTNVDATNSSTGITDSPTCFNGGTTQNDVFFSFMVDASQVDLTITVEGTDMGANGSIENPQFAIYRGSCAGLAELFCASADFGETSVSLDALGLTPGITYYLRINDFSNTGSPFWGDFTICMEMYNPSIIIGETASTTACSGSIFDPGGPDDDYSNGANATTTICPSEFPSCISLDVNFFDILPGDALTVYGGNSTAAPVVAALMGNSDGTDFEILAQSECVTLQFTSDGFGTGAGFDLAWQCSPLDCEGSDFDNPTTISAIPFNGTGFTTCGEGANFADTPCNLPFLNGPETVFIYTSPGAICGSVQVIGATAGTGVAVLSGIPGAPGTVCVAESADGSISSANFEDPGDYYIIVANPEGCTDFDLVMNVSTCSLSPALVDALCNPLNGCIQNGDITTEFQFDDGFQDIPLNPGINDGCWFGVGFEPDFYWFTIEAQADGPFGFILSSANVPSDIDFNVWGPFTPEQACETPEFIIDAVTNTQPIRSSYAGGTEPTGLADIHPTLGYPVTDVYDCDPGGMNDDIVSTIAAQTGEVYVVLANDWGNQIEDGGILVDWGPSDPDVLQPLGFTVLAADTSVCIGQTVQLDVITSIDNIQWVGANTNELSCTNCFDPVASPSQTQVFRAVLNTVCSSDTIDVQVNVFDLDAGPDIEVCTGEQFTIPGGEEFDMATYEWIPPAGLNFSCTDCPSPMVEAAAPGNYDVQVILTADACMFMDIVTVNVLNFTAPEYMVADDEQICDGESREIGGNLVAGNTYTWTAVPAGEVLSGSNPTVQPDVTTTYFLSVINGECPSPSVDSVTISVVELPLIEIGDSPDQICLGDTIALANTGVEADVAYNWTGPTLIFTPDSNFTVITPTVTGTYTLTGDRMGCQSQDAVMIEVTPIAIDLNQPDTTFICQGEDVAVMASVTPANAEIVWTPVGISGTSPVLSPDTYTSYTATVTVGVCVRVDSFNIQVDSLPMDMSIVNQPMEDSYCQGELVQLVSPVYDPAFYPDITHMWTGPGQETSDTLYNLVFTTADTFVYSRVTINGGCIQEDTIQINVISNDDLSITPAAPEICPGESVELLATAPMLGELEWTPATNLSCTDCPNPTASPSNTTTYNLSSDIEGCAVEQSVTVTVINIAAFNPSDQAICFGEEVQLFGTEGQAGVIYAWTSPDDPTFSSDVANPTVSPSTTTIYNGTATSTCGVTEASVTVSVIEEGNILSVAGGLETIVICNDQVLNLTAEIQNSNAPSESIVWEFNGEVYSGPDVEIPLTADVTSGTATLTYIYGATLNAEDQCELEEATVFIQVNAAPTLSVINDQVICFSDDPQIFILNAEDGQPGVSYSWTSSDGSLTSNEPNPEVQSPTNTTSYFLEAALGECVSLDTVTITVIQAATIVAGENQVITDATPTATLEATVTNGDSSMIEWSFGTPPVIVGMGSPFEWEPTAAQSDSLPGYVYATLDTGCEIITDSLFVQNIDYRLPNIFSPNGDQVNGVFKPFFLGEVEEVEVYVYNRWGQLIFESSDPNNPGWDGQKDGTPVPSDVYLYRVVVSIDGVKDERTGEVTLVR